MKISIDVKCPRNGYITNLQDNVGTAETKGNLHLQNGFLVMTKRIENKTRLYKQQSGKTLIGGIKLEGGHST